MGTYVFGCYYTDEEVKEIITDDKFSRSYDQKVLKNKEVLECAEVIITKD